MGATIPAVGVEGCGGADHGAGGDAGAAGKPGGAPSVRPLKNALASRSIVATSGTKP
jgi:hypothetical protein